MKLASYKCGRDGKLMVVSRNLANAVPASEVIGNMQGLLDNWSELAPRLNQISDALNRGERQDAEPFDIGSCAAPLPRAYSWNDGSVYLNHMRLLKQLLGIEMPSERPLTPAMYQGGSDTFLGPLDDIVLPKADEWGLDYEAELAVITDDVPMGVGAADALNYVRLVTIINDISYRTLLGPEMQSGFGPIVSKPSTSFAPVVATPDELGEAWHDGRLSMTMVTSLNGSVMGRPNAGQGMAFTFRDLIAHLVRSRHVGAGAIIGTGTVSNEQPLNSAEVTKGGVGASCIAELRTIEKLVTGEYRTPFLKFGDRVRIEMLDSEGRSVFGAMDQQVVLHEPLG